jgi:hypothetical protein
MMLFQHIYRLFTWIEDSLEEYLSKHEYLFSEDDYHLPNLIGKMREDLLYLKKLKTGWEKHIHRIASVCWMDFGFDYLDKVREDLQSELADFDQLCLKDLDDWIETIDQIRDNFDAWQERRRDEFELHYSVTETTLRIIVEKAKIFGNVVDGFEHNIEYL